jgi:RimJ/RimL family protein N-acetyltransferase
VNLRAATPDDARLLWVWRNDPETRAMSREVREIPWVEHEAWLLRVLGDPHRCVLIGESDGRPVGVVRFDRSGTSEAEISISVGPAERGRGHATTLLRSASAHARDHQGLTRRNASVKSGNAPSLALFTKAGFESQSLDDGVGRFVLNL